MVGNNPNYNKYDIIRCFLLLSEKLSRAELVKKLNLGEGTIRTILDILKKKGLLKSDRQGHSLSEKGNQLMKKLSSLKVSNFESKQLFPDKKKIAVLIKNAKTTKKDYELRDIALKNRADGAIILKYNNGLKMQEDPNFNISELTNLFEYNENDILSIIFGDDKSDLERAGIAIFIEISKINLF